ncbi:MAG TPA: CNNM domain-containing protein, partial [Planctomycetota bacterium]|nr:CNNM domain-containing protein [Planctomycetota bacterium]
MIWDWTTFVGIFLLGCSALFSSSETAFFSLGGDAMGRTLDRRVQRLLQEPRELLVSLLAGNLFVNVFYFAIAKHLLPFHGLTSALVSLITILIVGEILPKALALRMPHRIAHLTAPFWLPYVRLMSPVRSAVSRGLDLCLRALGEHDRTEVGLTVEALAGALEASAAEGSLEHGEADLLGEIIQVSTLRVREIMTPRVDVLALDLEEDAADHRRVIEQARRQRITWLPVVRGDMDSVEGAV